MKITLDKILSKLKPHEFDIVYEDVKSIVIFPKTEKAAAYLSFNTNWTLNNGIFSLNSIYRGKKNQFNGIHHFIEINKTNEKIKFLYDFLYGRFYPASNLSESFNKRISQGIKSESILKYFINNSIENKSDNYFCLSKFPLTTLHNLTKVNGFLDLSGCNLNSLGDLEYIGKSLDIQDTKIENLGKLKYVSYKIYISNTPLSANYTIDELEIKYPQFKGKLLSD